MREILFSLVFAAALVDQSVRAPDAFQSVMPNGQIEFANEAASAERGKGLAECEQGSLDGRGCLVRLVVSRPRVLGQARRSLLLEAAQPLADRGRGGGKQACGGLDAALPGTFDGKSLQTVVVGVFHFSRIKAK